MQRLHAEDTHLHALVEKAARQASDLLGTVVRDMPLYTLHNERHILNIVGWMETLLGPKGLPTLSPLECAVCLLAAYTHDLGMTLTEDERQALPQDPEYLRFRESFLEERHLIDRLRESKEHDRANLIENHLRTEYLRRTHSDQLAERMRRRIREIAPDLRSGGFEFRRQLELVAISHNWPVEWLRHQFAREGLESNEIVGHKKVNFIRASVLLRLADILDFDASRTPTILFRHIGLDQDLSTSFASISEREWQKHLAVTGIDWENGILRYRAASCSHPAVEKSIRSFVSQIEAEFSQCAAEMRLCPAEHRVFNVPEDVKAEITASKDSQNRPVYEYHDWSFRLDQQEIIQLLMGESLYGDPSLCIRELLQNALDALELRDLRHQMKNLGATPAEPVDSEQTVPGSYLKNGKQVPLEVHLSWGEEDGLKFVRVEDNGVGMTKEVVERYFTNIGKSYYRNPNFRGEQAEMRRHGLILTPISTFGIGVLSCFMVADRIEVQTCPGEAGADRPPLDFTISGPGSLFWTKPGTRTNQGTTVTIWVRSELLGIPVTFANSREDCWERLREFHGYKERTYARERTFDPSEIAGRYVVWPKYPIKICPPAGDWWAIDERFHPEILARINPGVVSEKFKEWEYPETSISQPAWKLVDWCDDDAQEGTGSRIRVWMPSARDCKLEPWQLSLFVSPQVSEDNPLKFFAQSMHVENRRLSRELLFAVPRPGFRIWVDLRGSLAPSLKADRTDVQASWPGAAAKNLWFSLVGRLNAQLSTVPTIAQGWWCSDFPLAPPVAKSAGRATYELWAGAVGGASRLLSVQFIHTQIALLRARDHEWDYQFRFALRRTLTRSLAPSCALDLALVLHLVRDRYLVPSAFDNALTRDLNRAREVAREFTQARNSGLGFGAELSHHYQLTERENQFVQMHIQQFGYGPSLERSIPIAGLDHLEGLVGNATLLAPARFSFELEANRVTPCDHSGLKPAELTKFGYDICLPMSIVPLGALRREFGRWRTDDRYHALGALPFLIPYLREVWHQHRDVLKQLFPVPSLYCLKPAEELWLKPFTDWTKRDWRHPEHRSVLWDIPNGEVLIANGIHKRATFKIHANCYATDTSTTPQASSY